jgi:hypothetical protein
MRRAKRHEARLAEKALVNQPKTSTPTAAPKAEQGKDKG